MIIPKWFGYNMPFVSTAGVMPLQADERLIKNDLVQLLLTSPGERVMRPSFGSAINSFVFELSDDDSIEDLRSSIIRTITNNEPRINLNSVDINASANELIIKIVASLVLDSSKTFEFEIGVNPK